MIKSIPKSIKIEFWVILLKSPIFVKRFLTEVKFCCHWVPEFSFHRVLLHTQTILHMFCICLLWNCLEIPFLTTLNLPKTCARFYAYPLTSYLLIRFPKKYSWYLIGNLVNRQSRFSIILRISHVNVWSTWTQILI